MIGYGTEQVVHRTILKDCTVLGMVGDHTHGRVALVRSRTTQILEHGEAVGHHELGQLLDGQDVVV